MNSLAGLLRGHSHNGKSHALSEHDAYVQIYGERTVRSRPARVVLEAPEREEREERPRDARGRFLPRSAV